MPCDSRISTKMTDWQAARRAAGIAGKIVSETATEFRVAIGEKTGAFFRVSGGINAVADADVINRVTEEYARGAVSDWATENGYTVRVEGDEMVLENWG